MKIGCRGKAIGLDDPDGDLSFLSHAHSDHTFSPRKQPNIIASQETLDLLGYKVGPSTHEGVRLFAAGHILGARMMMAECDGGSVLYTGDFSIKPNAFGLKAEAPSCDRLIMEATYGDPSYVFPPFEDIAADLSSWVRRNDDKNLVIGTYELGKAQDVIKILNEAGVAPIVPEKTDRFSSVYDRYGYKLDRMVVGSEEAEEAMGRPFVALVPMHKAKRYFAYRLAQAFERETLCAAATGWALRFRMNVDASFPLSDHADFNDLVRFASESGAKRIEFFCGDGGAVLDALGRRSESLYC